MTHGNTNFERKQRSKKINIRKDRKRYNDWKRKRRQQRKRKRGEKWG